MKYLLILLALLLPSAALAQSQVALNSEVFVERTTQDATGAARVALVPPSVVTPGDPLVFVLSYHNNGAAPAVSFVRTESAGAVYSVDGGRSWGALAELRVRNADGTSRAAGPADVTHVRWRLARAIPAGGGGELRFRGVVK